MNPIIEISEDGTLQLPLEVLTAINAQQRFRVEVKDGSVILSPENRPQPFWATATPQERAKRLLQWAASHKDGPNLPDEALRRENIYD